MISVLLGGFIGTFLRFAILERLKGKTSIFPSAVLFVNLGGSLLIGFMAGAGLNAASMTGKFIFTGCLGAFTTFSTFSVEAAELWKDGKKRLFVFYLLLSLFGSLLLCFAGYWLGHITGGGAGI